ncbi:EF-hand domain-containing protein [Lutibacter sp.]|uniref:EF-hand domain-containing protein n=1 Tax=Lutibacter sp. TaxID=1925666 RepID=UPI0025B7FD0A|nr:EF-hand domain-containing protein [Lutibacter sp.]MCF6167246.1 EF-hand domain-containing protein [Lutibacter sp.]
MKTTKFSTLTTFAIIMLLSINAYSQGRGIQNRPMFETFDLNGDGRITASEFKKVRAERQKNNPGIGRNQANAPSFESMDLNNDGIILPAEFAKYQANKRFKRK